MEEASKVPPRRTLLQRGLLLVGGAFGFAAIDAKHLDRKELETPSRPSHPASQVLRVYTRCRQVHSPVLPGKENLNRSATLVRSGELLDGPAGKKVGDFHATCLCLESAFGLNPLAASNVELQTLKLEGGTIFGMGAGAASDVCEREHAVVGGTGRFAGARGSYVIRRPAGETDTQEFVLMLSI